MTYRIRQFTSALAVTLAFLLSALTPAQCQDPSQPQQQINTRALNVYLQNPPVPMNNINAGIIGVPGTASYCYWVVAHYVIGVTSPGGPACVGNANGTLSGSNKVLISWPANPNIATYDVLRTTGTTAPSGNCACAVGTALTGTNTTDTSNTLNAYTVAAAFDPNSAVLSLFNVPTGDGTSALEAFTSTGSLASLIVGQATVQPANCTLTPQYQGSNGYVVNLWVCHSSFALNTAATFTDSPVTMIPQHGTVSDVSCRITTTITTATTWSTTCDGTGSTTNAACGSTDNTNAAFTNAITSLTAGTVIPLTGTNAVGAVPVGMFNDTAHKMRIGLDAMHGAGAMSCSVTSTAPSGPTS